MPRQDEFGRDIDSDNDSEDSRSNSPPRRRRRYSRSRSDSPSRRRRSLSRSPRRLKSNDRRYLGSGHLNQDRKPIYQPPLPLHPPLRKYDTNVANMKSIPFPPSTEPPPAPTPPKLGGGKGRANIQIKAPIAGTEPFKSYLEWKAGLKDGETSSEAAYSAWQSDYVNTLKETLVIEAQSFEWFADRYDPIRRVAQKSALLNHKLKASEVLAAKIVQIATTSSNELVKSLSLSSSAESGQLDNPPSLQGVPGVHNERHRLVTVRKIPPWCSRTDLEKTLEEAVTQLDGKEEKRPKVVDAVFMSDASRGRGKGYISTAWVLYHDASIARTAAPVLGAQTSCGGWVSRPLEGVEVVVAGGDEAEPKRVRLGAVELYRERRPRYCPDVFAHPDRIKFDLKMALELAASFDAGLTTTLASVLEKGAIQSALACIMAAAEEERATVQALSIQAAERAQVAALASFSESEKATAAQHALSGAVVTAANAKVVVADATKAVETGGEDSALKLALDALAGAEEEVSKLSKELSEMAAASKLAATVMLEASLAADEASSALVACYDGPTAAAALELDVCIAWLRGVHLFAYYGGTQCRDVGDLLDSEDAIYVRPKHKLKKKKDEDDHLRRPKRSKKGGGDEVLDIDVRLAMRCASLLEEGQELEAMADFGGASGKYEEMKSLGSHFQDRDMGVQVAQGAEEAISALPSVPLPPSIQLKGLSKDTEVMRVQEEPSWAKYEAPSSLSFVRDMDSRIEKHILAAEGKDAVDEQAEALDARISFATEEWLESNITMIPNKKDPSLINAKCCFANCNKVFKDKTFATKHLVAKHSQELEHMLWPIRKEVMLVAFSRDHCAPLPLVECSDGSSYPITVDPVDILNGKFVAPPPPPRPPRQEKSSRPRSGSFGTPRDHTPRPKVTYVDVDAPKTASVDVDYGATLQLAALAPKKKKRKKTKVAEKEPE